MTNSKYMYHIFIHSSVHGHLGCFHVLVIVNSAAIVNIRVHVSFSIMVSSEYMPSSGIVRSYGSFILSFLRNLHTVLPQWLYQFTFHQQCKGLRFSPHPLQCLLFVHFFDDIYSDWYEVMSHCSFDLHFSNNE